MQIIIVILIIVFFKDILFAVLGWIFNRIIDLFLLIGDMKYSIDSYNQRRRTQQYEKLQNKKRQYQLSEIEKAYENKEYKQAVTLFRAMQKEGFISKSEKEKYYGIAACSLAEIATTTAEWEEARRWAMTSEVNSESGNDDALNKVMDLGEEIFDEQDAALEVAQEYLNSYDVEAAISLLKEKADSGNAYAMIGYTEVMLKTMKNEEDIASTKTMLEKLRPFAEKRTLEKFDNLFNESKVVNFFKYYAKHRELLEKAKESEDDSFYDLTYEAFSELERAAEYRDDAGFFVSLADTFVVNAEMFLRGNTCNKSFFEKHLECYKKALKWAKKALECGADEKVEAQISSLEEKITCATPALCRLNAFHDLAKRAKDCSNTDETIKTLADAAENLQDVAKYVLTDKICELLMNSYLTLAEMQKKAHPKGNESFEVYADFYKRAYLWCKKGSEIDSKKAQEKLPEIEKWTKYILFTQEYDKEKEKNNE